MIRRCYPPGMAGATLFLVILMTIPAIGCGEQPGGGFWPNPDDRLFNIEACYFKYGVLPVDPSKLYKPPPPPDTPVVPEHNAAMEECKRTFFRQKFCRNQWKQIHGKPYQRICKTMNMNSLKLFATSFGCIGFGAFLRTMMKLFKIPFPYTVMLMLIGLGLGSLSHIEAFCYEWTPYTSIARTPPTILLNVFLPILIFDASFGMTAHLFFKSIFSILMLALPGMLITTFATAALCQQFFFSYGWTFLHACLFGAIISATDPVAVVAILKEVGTSETLGILVDGESLLNDGVAILLFEIFSELLQEEEQEINLDNHHESQALKMFITFARITLGGPAFGWVIAKLTVRFLSLIFNDAAVEVSVTLCAAYLTYFIAENVLCVSGVMALVLLGITLSAERTCISSEVQGLVRIFWEMLGYLANTLLFVILGIVIAETAVNSFKLEDGYYLLFLYFGLNIVRFLMIGVMSPLLSRIGYGLSWQNVVVMTWGGLRGAVGVCLALQVYKNKVICHRENIGPKMLIQTAGIVFLTLVINGSTTKVLLDMLGLSALSVGKIQDMANAVKQVRVSQQKALKLLRHGRFLSDADWTMVEENSNIIDPYEERGRKTMAALEKSKKPPLLEGLPKEPTATCPDCDIKIPAEPGGEEMRELTEEARLRLLKALRVSCWAQYDSGLLTDQSVRILNDRLESLEDRKYEMITPGEIANYWKVTGFFASARQKLSKFDVDDDPDDIPLPDKRWKQVCLKISISCWFPIVMYIIIIANLVVTLWEASYIIHEDSQFTSLEYIFFYALNVTFTGLYMLEAFIKITGLGCLKYMSSKWTIFEIVILIISVVELVITGIFLRDELRNASDAGYVQRSSEEADFLKFIRFIRAARLLRILLFFRPVIPAVMNFLNTKVNERLFLAYDLGKGFVTAIEDVNKFLPQIMEQPRILGKFRSILENERVLVVREMGLLQLEYPGIAVAVKTRHAARGVLNQMFSMLKDMKEEGLVGDTEFEALKAEVEGKVKLLWNSPSCMKQTSPEMALANIAWMAVTIGSRELYEFVYNQSTLLSFKKDEIVRQPNDPANGIYIVISGMVRVEYEPSNQVLISRQGFGILPNVAVYQDIYYEIEMTDFFTSGTVLGELGVLAGVPNAGLISCETDVTIYHIPQSVMRSALTAFVEQFDSLESRMWRAYGMKVAASLLPNDSNFASWTFERVKLYLEKSAVPLDRMNESSLVVPEFVSDIVLIFGQVCNASERTEVYTAPCVIPRTVEFLMELPDSPVIPRILVIANEDMDIQEPSEDKKQRGKQENAMQILLQRGLRGNQVTEDDVQNIQQRRKSRTVDFGVVPEVRGKAVGKAVAKPGTK